MKKLCRVLDRNRLYPFEFRRKFPEGYSLAMRPFNVREDMGIISGWMGSNLAYYRQAGNDPEMLLRQAYYLSLASDKSQPFMGFLDEEPAFQVDFNMPEVCGARLYYTAREGDLVFSFLVDPRLKDVRTHFLENCMRAIMAFSFSFEEVKRLVFCLDSINSKQWLVIGKEDYGTLQITIPDARNTFLFGYFR